MRLLLEILIIGALIYVGWEIPFRDRLPANISGVAKNSASAASPPPASRVQQQTAAAAPQSIDTGTAPYQPFVRPPPTPSGAWMWDPNRRSALDRPTLSPTIPR